MANGRLAMTTAWIHVWMAPAWQEEMQRAAQKSLLVVTVLAGCLLLPLAVRTLIQIVGSYEHFETGYRDN